MYMNTAIHEGELGELWRAMAADGLPTMDSSISR